MSFLVQRARPQMIGGCDCGRPSMRRLADLGGDGLHGREVVRRGGREAGLDDVDAEAGERAGDLELFCRGHGRTGRLLAVAEAGVEDSERSWERKFSWK
jgi:hypothetical protein